MNKSLGLFSRDMTFSESFSTMGDKMTDSTLSKLLSVDSDLVVRETELRVQLEAIQTKRASLQTVLKMFDGDKATKPDMKAAKEMSAIAAAAIASPTVATAKVSTSGKKPKAKGKAAQSRKSSRSSKASRRGWREYVRDEYRQRPLSAVVSLVLQVQPKKVFEIAEVVDTIFVKTMPSTARTSARERVSNILAEGARKEWWYRSQSGN